MYGSVDSKPSCIPCITQTKDPHRFWQREAQASGKGEHLYRWCACSPGAASLLCLAPGEALQLALVLEAEPLGLWGMPYPKISVSGGG